MTQEQKTRIEEHYDRLYHIATVDNIPDDIRDALKAAYLAGAAYALDIYCHRWISVDDELPMEYEPVLAAFGNHYARVCFYSGGKWYIDAGVISYEVFCVSHWMQISPPPKKGGEA